MWACLTPGIAAPSWRPIMTAVEAVMPMRVVAEDLTDSRPQLAALKAIRMGPFLMAGTSGGRSAAAGWSSSVSEGPGSRGSGH